MVDGKVTSAADPLWSKAFYLDGGLQVNGLTVGQVNLHSGYSVIGSTLFNGIGTVCHEFLHSMGYPDLYHRSDVVNIAIVVPIQRNICRNCNILNHFNGILVIVRVRFPTLTQHFRQRQKQPSDR